MSAEILAFHKRLLQPEPSVPAEAVGPVANCVAVVVVPRAQHVVAAVAAAVGIGRSPAAAVAAVAAAAACVAMDGEVIQVSVLIVSSPRGALHLLLHHCFAVAWPGNWSLCRGLASGPDPFGPACFVPAHCHRRCCTKSKQTMNFERLAGGGTFG